MQTETFEPEGVKIEGVVKDRPYYLLCADCKTEIFSNLQGYKTIIERKVVLV